MTQVEQNLDLLIRLYTQLKLILEAYQSGLRIDTRKTLEINELLEESCIYLRNYVSSKLPSDDFIQRDLESFMKSMILQLPDLIKLAEQTDDVRILLMSDFKDALRWNRNYRVFQNVALLKNSILDQSMNVCVQVEVKQ